MAIDDKKLVAIYLKRVKDSEKISAPNKKDIVRYYTMRSSNGVALGSNRYVLFVLWRLGLILAKRI